MNPRKSSIKFGHPLFFLGKVRLHNSKVLGAVVSFTDKGDSDAKIYNLCMESRKGPATGCSQESLDIQKLSRSIWCTERSCVAHQKNPSYMESVKGHECSTLTLISLPICFHSKRQGYRGGDLLSCSNFLNSLHLPSHRLILL